MATTIQNPPPTSPGPEPEEEQLGGRQMSFLEHLEELRARLLRRAASILIGTGISYYLRDAIYGYMARPVSASLRSLGHSDKLHYHTPDDRPQLHIQLHTLARIFLG